MSFLKFVSKCGRSGRHSRRKPPRKRAARAPQVEWLEDRLTPTVLFTPRYGAEATTDHGGEKLGDVPVYLIFWGDQWNTQYSDLRAQIQTAAASILGGPYLSGATQYGSQIGRGHVERSITYTDTSPANDFTDEQVQDVQDNADLPEPDDTDQAPLYVVFTPPNLEYDHQRDIGGYHTYWVDDDLLGYDDDTYYYALVTTQGNSTAEQLDFATHVFSHELVESVTDPYTGIDSFFIQRGITATPGASYLWGVPGESEIGDFEARDYSGVYLNGFLVQPYWSQRDGAFIVPSNPGESQNFTVAWDGSTYGLTVNGDQLRQGYDDAVSVSEVNGVVQVDLNGQVARLPRGEIGSVVVNPGAGRNVVVVQSSAADLPVTVNSTGDDSVDGSLSNVRVNQNGGTVTFANPVTLSNLALSQGTVVVNAPLTVTNLTFTGGTLTGPGAVTLAGNSTWSGGTMSGAGTTTVAAGVTLTVNAPGGATLAGRTLSGAGAVVFAGGVSAIGDTYNVSGTTSVTGGLVTFSGTGAGLGAALTISGGEADFSTAQPVTLPATTLSGGILGGAGTVVAAGPFTWGGGLISVGTLTGPGAVTVTANSAWSGGTMSGTGTTTVAAGATLTVAGTGGATLAGRTLGGAGTVVAAGPFTWGGGLISVGTLTGPGAVTVTADSTWSGGTMGGAGTTTVAAGVTLTVAGGLISVGTLTGPGAVTVTANSAWSGGTMGGAGTTTVAAGVTLTVAGTGGATLAGRTLGGAGTVVAAGPFTWGGGLISVGTLTGPGAVTVTANSAWSGGTMSGAGTTTVAAGATLTVAGTGGGTLVGRTLNGGGAVVFAGGPAAIAGTYNVGGSTSVTGGTVTFSGTVAGLGAALTISAGEADFSTAQPVALPATTLSGGVLGGSDTVVAAGPFTWTGGTMGGTGTTTIPAGRTLTVSGGAAKTLDTRTLANAGTVTWSGGGIGWANGATLSNLPGGLFDAQGSNLGGSGLFSNAGTLRKAVGGTTAVAVPLANTGTVYVSAGTLRLLGGATSGGRFDVLLTSQVDFAGGTATLGGTLVAARATLSFSGGSATVNGAISLSGNATLAFSGGSTTVNGAVALSGNSSLVFSGGSHTLSPTSSVTGSGTVQVSGATATVTAAGTYNVPTTSITGGTLNFAGPATSLGLTLSGGTLTGTGTVTVSGLTLSGGTLTGTGTVTVSGLLTWSGGTMSGRGVTAANGTVAVSGTAGKVLDGRTLNVAGAATWSGTGRIDAANGAVVNNLATGLFDVQNDVEFGLLAGTAQFVNAGQFQKSGGTGTTTLRLTFTNNGTVQVPRGTLSLLGGLTNFAGGTLTGGTYVVLGTLQFLGAGIRTNAAALTLDGPGARVVSETGADALANFATNASAGQLTLRNRAFTPTAAFANAGVVTFDTGSSLTLLGTWDNPGRVRWASSQNVSFSGSSVFTNEASGVVEVQTAITFSRSSSSGSPHFDNAGTFTKSTSTGTTTVASPVAFNNSGTIQVLAGTLSLAGGGSLSGNFVITAGAVSLTGGTFAIQDGATGTGAGTLGVAGATATLNAGAAASVSNLAVSGGTLTAAGNLGVGGTFTLSGGTLAGAGSVTVGGLLTWTGGTMTGPGATNANGGLTLNVGGTVASLDQGRALNTAGACVYTAAGGYLSLSRGATLTNLGAGVWDVQGNAPINNSYGGAAAFSNAGLFQKSAGTTTVSGVTFSNTGTIQVQTGTLDLAGGLTNFSATTLTGGTYLIQGTLRFPGADVRTNAATIVLDGPGAQIVNPSGVNALHNFTTNTATGALTLLNGQALTTAGALSNAGAVTVGANSLLQAGGDYVQTAGTTALAGGALAANFTVRINGGVLSGSGAIFADVVNAGQITMTGSASQLTIYGDYTQTATGVLNLRLGNFANGEYDQLNVLGTATLDGTLNVTLLDSFLANVGDGYAVLTWGYRVGNFATVNLASLGDPFYLDPQFADANLTLTLRSRM